MTKRKKIACLTFYAFYAFFAFYTFYVFYASDNLNYYTTPLNILISWEYLFLKLGTASGVTRKGSVDTKFL